MRSWLVSTIFEIATVVLFFIAGAALTVGMLGVG